MGCQDEPGLALGLKILVAVGMRRARLAYWTRDIRPLRNLLPSDLRAGVANTTISYLQLLLPIEGCESSQEGSKEGSGSDLRCAATRFLRLAACGYEVTSLLSLHKCLLLFRRKFLIRLNFVVLLNLRCACDRDLESPPSWHHNAVGLLAERTVFLRSAPGLPAAGSGDGARGAICGASAIGRARRWW